MSVREPAPIHTMIVQGATRCLVIQHACQRRDARVVPTFPSYKPKGHRESVAWATANETMAEVWHNQDVAAKDFGPMLAPLADDAELIVQGIAVGPFTGKAAMAAP